MAMDSPYAQRMYKNYLLEPNSEASESTLHVKRICLKCEPLAERPADSDKKKAN
ncbi:Uncharacterised protein [uncultured archaeon]|nr:Uncharacterised protein [uncultured archaeon]